MVYRYSESPLISPSDVRPFDERFEVVGVFNPGVTRFEGKILLLMRVAVRPKQEEGFVSVPVLRDGKVDVLKLDRADYDCSDSRFVVGKDGSRLLTSMSYFVVALSEDGISFRVESDRIMLPSEELEEYGIEDPRITHIDGYYYVTYSAISHCGICAALKRTKDFRSYERLGIILHPDNKDVAIFPEKIGGKYYLLHRPSISEFGTPDVWLAESENLMEWGNHRHVAGVRSHRWDGVRIGSSGVPVRVPEGWLVVYHGADANDTYCLGAFLLDAEQPWKVIGRTEEPFMRPELPCEREGFFSNVVFACGGIVRGDKLQIYYGATDKFICGGEVKISDIMEAMRK